VLVLSPLVLGAAGAAEKVMERGEKMDLLVDKTDNLNQQAFQFKKKSTQLKRAMWWKNTKLMAMIVFIVLVRQTRPRKKRDREREKESDARGFLGPTCQTLSLSLCLCLSLCASLSLCVSLSLSL
jgi:hypothetical protein